MFSLSFFHLMHWSVGCGYRSLHWGGCKIRLKGVKRHGIRSLPLVSGIHFVTYCRRLYHE